MEKHLYEIGLTNGAKHDVATPHHHDDHDREAWQKHIVDILKSIISGVATHHINNITYKGKAPR